eukprot:3490600-Pleurochrysis_carterae.AAC.1
MRSTRRLFRILRRHVVGRNIQRARGIFIRSLCVHVLSIRGHDALDNSVPDAVLVTETETIIRLATV